MYARLLADPYFQVSAMEAIHSWLQDETARIENTLLLVAQDSIDPLLRCLVSSKASLFENLLDPFLKIIKLSTPITIAMTNRPHSSNRSSTDWVHYNKLVMRPNLLRILRGM